MTNNLNKFVCSFFLTATSPLTDRTGSLIHYINTISGELIMLLQRISQTRIHLSIEKGLFVCICLIVTAETTDYDSHSSVFHILC